jgi:hypothetical protein
MIIMKIELPLVSLTTAKLLKEHGFDIPTHEYFGKRRNDKEYQEYVGYNDEYWGDNYESDWNTNGEPFKPFSKDCISRPNLYIVQRWLLVEHMIDIVASPYWEEEGVENYVKYYRLTISSPSNPDYIYGGFDGVDECLDFGIESTLERFYKIESDEEE